MGVHVSPIVNPSPTSLWFLQFMLPSQDPLQSSLHQEMSLFLLLPLALQCFVAFILAVVYCTLIPTTIYCELVAQMGSPRSKTPEALQKRPTFLPGSLTHSLFVLNTLESWSPWHPGLGHMPASDLCDYAWLPGCCSLASKLESPSCQGQMGFMVGRICAVTQASYQTNSLL